MGPRGKRAGDINRAAWENPNTRVAVFTLAGYEVVRFNEMKKYIGEISYKTLSSTLKVLEADGLIHRKEYPKIPPKVEYSLSEKGKSLIPILGEMCDWGEAHRE